MENKGEMEVGRKGEEDGKEGGRVHLSQVRLGSGGGRNPFPPVRLRRKEVKKTRGGEKRCSPAKGDKANTMPPRH